MADGNTVTLVGTLGADPEVRRTPTGKDVVSFDLVTNERIRAADGSWSDGAPSWFRVTAWNRLGLNAAGSFRKGLHHLCRAWQESGGAAGADLVVVARGVDAGMETLLAAAGIRWIRGLPRAELNWYYDHARVFVLPSQSEGFGQVYLEALAPGCRVIGTRHSVLPDLAAAQPWIDYVVPGETAMLAGAIRRALQRPEAPAGERAAVAASVADYTWESFRAGLESVLRRLD